MALGGACVARQDNDRWTRRIVQWRPRQHKRSAGRTQKRDSGKEMAPDGNEPIRMEAARGGLCPEVDAKGLLKEEKEENMSYIMFNFFDSI